MTLIIIVGLPAALVAVLWPWRFPVDRLHTSTEEGRREPSQLAEAAIGPSFTLYRPECWTTDSAELLSKVLLTSLVGVIFGSKSQQLIGLVVCVVLCCALLVLYMLLRPLRYDRGNTYKAIMYVGLIMKYIEGIVLATSAKDAIDQWPTKTSLVIVAVPVFVCVVDALHIPELLQSYTRWCGRCCRTSEAPDRGSVEVERERKAFRDLCTSSCQENKTASAALETRTLRARQFTNCFDDLVQCMLVVVQNYEQLVLGARPAGGKSIAKKPDSSAGNNRKAPIEFLKLAEDFVRAAVSSCEAAMASPHVGPSWDHLIALENHAVKISKFCFAARKHAHRKHPQLHITADETTSTAQQQHHKKRFGMVDLEIDSVSQLWLHKPVEFVATQLMPTPPTLVQTSTLTRIVTGIINPRAEKVDLFGPGMLEHTKSFSFKSTRSMSGREDEKKGARMQASDSIESKGGSGGAQGGGASSLSAPPAGISGGWDFSRVLMSTFFSGSVEHEVALEASRTLELMPAGNFPATDYSQSSHQSPSTPTLSSVLAETADSRETSFEAAV